MQNIHNIAKTMVCSRSQTSRLSKCLILQIPPGQDQYQFSAGLKLLKVDLKWTKLCVNHV